MKILIADDDLVSRNFLHALLLPYGKCDTAVDGKAAIIAFENALEDHKPYNLICLDVEMPEQNGQETLRQIRASEEKRGVGQQDRAKVIMITSSRDVQNVKTAFESKCEAYLVKPVRKERLLDEIARLNLNET